MHGDNETCAGCRTPLTEGVPDVLCPACALGRALALETEIVLASEPLRRESLSMSTVAPSAGDVLSDYKLLEKIGGNMGIVFKAVHENLGKTVALKLFPAENLADESKRRRFEREIRSMGKLTHENLVSASDARNVGPWHLVAMEWIDGRDLQQILRTEGPFPIDLACEAARQAALGLECAHRNQLVHRDVKPANLMLTPAGTIKVIDLGLALPMEDQSAQLTQTGNVLGSMPYCAPEQIRDPSNVDSRADIYSLGCTLYHLLAGRPPFSDRRHSVPEIIEAHRSEPFPSLLEVRPDAPPALDKLLKRMTAKDPGARLHSAAEVAERLEPFARGANLSRLLVPKSGRKASSDFGANEIPVEEKALASRGWTSRALWIGGSALVVALIMGLSLLIVSAVSNPIIVLMDTTAHGGVYDEETRKRGGTNAEELKKVLDPLYPNSLRQEQISLDWGRDAQVAAMRPHLVVIHRSSFFHSLNAELDFKSPPFTNHVDQALNDAESAKWQMLYRIGDERLCQFIGFVGSVGSKTKFLVYSRGTDVRWEEADFREKWVKELETKYPKLRGRVFTMLIPGRMEGSFHNAKTGEKMRAQVKAILED